MNENIQIIKTYTIDYQGKIHLNESCDSPQYIITVSKMNVLQDTPEWLENRKNYLTSTAIATILGLDSYTTKEKLILSKLGLLPDIKNINTLEGRIFEQYLYEMCKYYDFQNHSANDSLKVYERTLNNEIINEVSKDKNTYLLNISNGFESVDIMVSPDAVMKNGDNYIPVDIKRMGLYAYENYTGKGIYSSYVWQSVCQSLVYGSDIGYLFIMVLTNNNLIYKHDSISIKEYLPFLNNIISEGNKFIDLLNSLKGKHPSDIYKELNIETPYDNDIIDKISETLKDNEGNILEITPNVLPDDIQIKLNNYILGENKDRNINMHEVIQWEREEYQAYKEREESYSNVKNIIKNAFIGYDKILVRDEEGNLLYSINIKPFKVKIH